MKKPLLLVGVVVSAGACLLWGMCGMPSKRASPARGGQVSDGYWNSSCVTADDHWLAAGGDHAALIDVATGKIVERDPRMVKAIGCEGNTAIVFGYDGAFSLPGKTVLDPAPKLTGELITLTTDMAQVSWSRTLSGRRWKGPATLFVDRVGESKRLDLLPALFGTIGEARGLPTPDTFAVRIGQELDDARLLVAAGWQPSQSADAVEDVPWGFFAIDLTTGSATPLTMSLRSDAALNQGWVQKVGASPDGSVLAVAAHDGRQITVGAFAAGADKPTRLTSLVSRGSASAIAVSASGLLIAVGSESRGHDAPATAWVIDEAGKVIWQVEFPKTVTGLHFLEDSSLLVTSAQAVAVRVRLPQGKELWRSP